MIIVESHLLKRILERLRKISWAGIGNVSSGAKVFEEDPCIPKYVMPASQRAFNSRF